MAGGWGDFLRVWHERSGSVNRLGLNFEREARMIVALLSLSLSANATEVHPKFIWNKCTKAGCTAVNGFMVHDKHLRGYMASWR
jgi:hypothetical protein